MIMKVLIQNFKLSLIKTPIKVLFLLLVCSYSYALSKNDVLLRDSFSTINALQSRTVSGTVTDELSNDPLPGVSIVIENTSIGTTTDFDGKYTLTIPSSIEGDVNVIFSYIGYSKETRSISATNNNSTMNVSMSVDGEMLNEVIITANKRSQTVMEVPMSVQALSGKKMAESGLRDLSDVITLVPGATETVSNNIGQRQYQIRGIPQVVGDPTVGYYLGEAAFNYFGGRFSPVSRAFDIQRVEVLRGPQSTLYGNGAMGGVIKFVPNAPDLTKFGGEVGMGVNTIKGGDAGYYGDLMLNLPIAKDKLGVRVSGSLEEVGGYVDATDGSEENINGGDLKQFRAQLLYTPVEALKIELTYQKNATDQSVGSFAEDIDQPSTAINPANFFKVDNDWFIGTVSYDFKNFATLTTSTSSIKGENKVHNFVPDALGPGADLTIDNDDDFSAINHETRLVSNTDSPFQWVAGVFLTNSDFATSTVYDPDLTDLGVPNSVNDLESNATSFFGEISYGFLDNKLTALFGLRSFSDKRSSDDNAGTLIEDTFKSTNPRFNLSYRPTKNATYFFNVAKGFRSGNFNTPQTVALHELSNLPATSSVDSDELLSYEVGTKHVLANGQVNLELSAYMQNWKNMQSQIAEPQFGESATYQVGDAKIPGIDISLGYNPKSVSGLSFQTVVNINDAKFDEINPEIAGLLNSENGDRIQLVPAWTLGFNTSYSYSLGNNGWTGNVLANLSHADKQIGFGMNAEGEAQTQLAIRLGVQKDKFDIVLFGSNLLGEEGAIFVLDEAGFRTNFIPRPQSFGLQVGYRF